MMRQPNPAVTILVGLFLVAFGVAVGVAASAQLLPPGMYYVAAFDVFAGAGMVALGVWMGRDD